MSETRKTSFLLAMTVTVASVGFCADQPTTPSWSMPSDWTGVIREQLAPYKPAIDKTLDKWRKKSGEELRKLQQWEYKVVSVQSADPVALALALNQSGDEGWECFHVTSAAPAEPGELPGKHLLFFRKRKGSWIAQIPLRDVLKLLIHLTGEGGDSAD